jgi:hypothetical protein
MRKAISILVFVAFMGTSMPSLDYAQTSPFPWMPKPGAMVDLSPFFDPAIIKGITIHKDNPFLFDFIVDCGQDHLQGEALKNEGEKLIKYFLASLTIPEKELWVNLSPYEKDRTIPEALAQTEMGRDLLSQDYILKQLTASLIYPERELGKAFWEKVYTKARQMYGTTQVPVNTFNKVWIIADKASVFEHNQTAVVVSSHLKVMLEEDYLAMLKRGHVPPLRREYVSPFQQIIREIILPEIEKEVNYGRNFANLRQITNSLILASWYKKNLKAAILNQIYADKEKIKGIDLEDKNIKEEIYDRYLQAYKKGVFNFIKEDRDVGFYAPVPRKYFSGGWNPAMAAEPETLQAETPEIDAAIDGIDNSSLVDITAGVRIGSDAAMQSKANPARTVVSLLRYVLDNGFLTGSLLDISVVWKGGNPSAVQEIIDKLVGDMLVVNESNNFSDILYVRSIDDLRAELDQMDADLQQNPNAYGEFKNEKEIVIGLPKLGRKSEGLLPTRVRLPALTLPKPAVPVEGRSPQELAFEIAANMTAKRAQEIVSYMLANAERFQPNTLALRVAAASYVLDHPKEFRPEIFNQAVSVLRITALTDLADWKMKEKIASVITAADKILSSSYFGETSLNAARQLRLAWGRSNYKDLVAPVLLLHSAFKPLHEEAKKRLLSIQQIPFPTAVRILRSHDEAFSRLFGPAAQVVTKSFERYSKGVFGQKSMGIMPLYEILDLVFSAGEKADELGLGDIKKKAQDTWNDMAKSNSFPHRFVAALLLLTYSTQAETARKLAEEGAIRKAVQAEAARKAAEEEAAIKTAQEEAARQRQGAREARARARQAEKTAQRAAKMQVTADTPVAFGRNSSSYGSVMKALDEVLVKLQYADLRIKSSGKVYYNYMPEDELLIYAIDDIISALIPIRRNKELKARLKIFDMQIKSDRFQFITTQFDLPDGEMPEIAKILMVIKAHFAKATTLALRQKALNGSEVVHQAFDDFAMAALANGGIDLNTGHINWDITKDSRGVQMDVDPAMLERIRHEGIASLSPVIFRITTITNVWSLFDLKPPTLG